MVGVESRWNSLKLKLLQLRHGPGAAILPPEVTRIHLEFAKYLNNGHMGPRRFWRDQLPRLKYYNPAIPMIVNRKQDQESPAIMTIYLRKDASAPAASSTETPGGNIARIQPSSSAMDQSKATAPTPDERIVKFDMQHKRSEQILEMFMAATKAQQIHPTPEETIELKQAEAFKRQGEVDRQRMRKLLEIERKEKAMLARAKAGLDSVD